MDESAGDVNAEEEKKCQKGSLRTGGVCYRQTLFFFLHHCCIQLLYLKEKNLLRCNIIVII